MDVRASGLLFPPGYLRQMEVTFQNLTNQLVTNSAFSRIVQRYRFTNDPRS
jgi:hypothetical protein